jgi:hypothetical protein
MRKTAGEASCTLVYTEQSAETEPVMLDLLNGVNDSEIN